MNRFARLLALILGCLVFFSAENAVAFDYAELCDSLLAQDLHPTVDVISSENLLIPAESLRFTVVDHLNRPTVFWETEAFYLDDSRWPRTPEEEAIACLASALEIPTEYVGNIDDANVAFVVFSGRELAVKTFDWTGLGQPTDYLLVPTMDSSAAYILQRRIESQQSTLGDDGDPLKLSSQRTEATTLDQFDFSTIRSPLYHGETRACVSEVVSSNESEEAFTRLLLPIGHIVGAELTLEGRLDDAPVRVFLNTMACLVVALFDELDTRRVVEVYGQRSVEVSQWGRRSFPPTFFTSEDGVTDFEGLCDDLEQARLHRDRDVVSRGNLRADLHVLDWVVWDRADRRDLVDPATLFETSIEPALEAIRCVAEQVGIEVNFSEQQSNSQNSMLTFLEVAYNSHILPVSPLYPERRPDNWDAYEHLGGVSVDAINVVQAGYGDGCIASLHAGPDGEKFLSMTYGWPDNRINHPEVVFGQVAACMIGALFVEFDPYLVGLAARYGQPL